MRSLAFAVLSLYVSITFAQSNAAPEMSIFKNPLAMTVTQVLAGPEHEITSTDYVNLIPSRSKTPLLEKSGLLRFTYTLQTDVTAPLVFVIPGTGGNANSQSAKFIAEQLFAMGYQTVIVDNPFSWNFVVAGSVSTLPGYPPQDAQDLYKALQAVNARLAATHKINPKAYSLIGSSLGGLDTLFLNKLDRQFHFEKILLINPPLDMIYAVKQLDRLFAEGDQLTVARKGEVFNQTLDVASTLLNRVDSLRDRAFMQSAFDKLGFSDRDMSYLIGWNFRSSLRDIIFASQQIHDTGILKIPATKYRRNARIEEAYGFSFTDYLKTFVFPNVLKGKSTVAAASFTLEDMNHEASIYQFAEEIRNNKNIYIIHSEDDFLLKQGDIQWMKSNFGSRATLFPYGGHCGSMNFSEFTEQLKVIFKK